MLKILLNVFLCMLLIACHNSTSDKAEILKENKLKDTTVSFAVIKKESAYINTYHFNKKNVSMGVTAFYYMGNEDTFSVLCDTSNKRYRGQFENGDTVVLDMENAKFYTINGTGFKVLKLIGDKSVIDGDFSLFVSPEFGLLINNSNTWRAAKVMCPDKSNPDYLQITALLYRIQTDDEFFPNPVPDIKKFTPPKVE